MEKQEFEVYAVPNSRPYTLTAKQLKELEAQKDNSAEIRRKNAETLQKINIRRSDELAQEVQEVELER